MKLYIIAIFILFSVTVYLIFSNEEGSNSYPPKVELTKSSEPISYNKENNDDIKEKEINYNKKEDITVNKKDENIKKTVTKEKETLKEDTKNDHFSEKDATSLDLLERIFSLKKKNNSTLQKDIANLESLLIAKLQNESDNDSYSMFRKILNSEDISLEDKKYAIDILGAVGTDESRVILVETYKNDNNEELKNKISKLDTPEVYTLLALEANQNEDTDNYQAMMNQLKITNEKEVISGFMAFTRNTDADSLNTITELTTQWSNSNLSEKSSEITEEYLSRPNAKPNERILAISILSNMKDKEARDRILTKALEHEENADVINSIQSTLEK